MEWQKKIQEEARTKRERENNNNNNIDLSDKYKA